MQLATASLTDQGGRPRNEDSFGDWSSERLYYCVVADGAGGHGGGDTASRLVVDSVLADLRYLTVAELPPTGERLISSLTHANENIVEEQLRGTGNEKDMRSTAVVLAIDRECATAAWAHCGDTRLYCFRHGEISARTRDHSMVQQMVDAHLLAEEQMRHHPRRNVLYAALGTRDPLPIDGLDGTFPLHDGDAFLICTDGLWEYADDAGIADALAHAATPGAWLDALAQRVRASASTNHDNFTALAVWINDDAEATLLMPGPAQA
ncbi:serine/threonine-protein phosphatase [Paraburkholderia sp. UYCP14C]|uniref:PP2C family protein-serine/threonine phosphatase n=1 Tax=Paraburkholderia sp. UYCP14C TaxID=2511130 RepID=UPI0010203606|nr:protein phosphatase 2C domain-containing protein [Paraburkholderia sp. UYCP14C]RZF28408.1 serine/threonine-protein phosphatase [Paraburkholderia sp. UYCP14C]